MCKDEYASFLIRCWSKMAADEDVYWQGEIEHIQTGHTVSIQSPEDLVAVLHEWPNGPEASIDTVES